MNKVLVGSAALSALLALAGCAPLPEQTPVASQSSAPVEDPAGTSGADHALACYNASGETVTPAPGRLRIASFNVALYRDAAGQLAADLASPDDQLDEGGSDRQIRAVAEVLQRVRPDIVLLNEFDFDPDARAVARFQAHFLAVPQGEAEPLSYAHQFIAPVNTGLPTTLDLDGNGRRGDPADAMGYGTFEGQYGMAILSRYPIAEDRVRTFQRFLWRDMPGALLPRPFYNEAIERELRLSSKSHWDVPILVGETTLHILAAHPTPTVFDGAEDRNGRRNNDEIRLWADYLGPAAAADYLYDDAGKRGGLPAGSAFVVLGDYNADPQDGDSWPGAANQLLRHAAVNASVTPASQGAVEDANLEGAVNRQHQGAAAHDTADFRGTGPGNLRIDYVLPSFAGLEPVCGGVFWPAVAEAGRDRVGSGGGGVVRPPAGLDGPSPQSARARVRARRRPMRR